MTPTNAQMIGMVLSGRYRIEAKIGSGGMSTVYLARDETLDRQVAIKLLHREISEQPDQLERFNLEARSVAKVSHPSVVTVIDAGEDSGRPYIVLEYVEGETLKDRIGREGRLDTRDAVAYAISIARGLSVAHARRLVHRDIKPQNVLIDTGGKVKLTDFGISRQLEQDGMTATGRVVGTTDYVAPEQALGKDVDPRCDIYSLGVVLYEMLTGEVPFTADSQVGVAMKHVTENLPDVQVMRPGVSAALALIVERATAKEPDERYLHVDAMIEDLETALAVERARGGTGDSSESTAVLEAVEVPRGRSGGLLHGRHWPWAGIAVVLTGVAVALAATALLSNGGAPGPAEQALDVGQPVELVDAVDFDPIAGDGENPDLLDAVINENPAATGGAWRTETYFGNFPDLKDGVGLYVEAAEAVAATDIEIYSVEPGWNVEIYATNEVPPESANDPLEGWTRVGEAQSLQLVEQIPLDTGGTPYRHYLIWITELLSVDAGEYRVEITEIRLYD